MDQVTDAPSAQAILAAGVKMHAEVVAACLPALEAPFAEAVALCEAALRAGGKIVLFGNGGSAADAQHIAAELTIRFTADRPALAALALTTDTSALTACGNDYGFARIFSRQVEALVRQGDAVIGLSTSGRSENVLAGLEAARAQGARTIGLCGGTGGDMARVCDTVLCAPSAVTARVQEVHILLGHLLCEALERRLFAGLRA